MQRFSLSICEVMAAGGFCTFFWPLDNTFGLCFREVRSPSSSDSSLSKSAALSGKPKRSNQFSDSDAEGLRYIVLNLD